VTVDSSAFVAILLDEPDAPFFLSKLERADVLRTSAATVVETSTVLFARGGRVKLDAFDALRRWYDIEVTPVNEEQAMIAREAFVRYGRGLGHKAALNLGDCFSYALAKTYGESLLFKGNDFTQTDIVVA
jgi:ribonuclease VapC